MEEIPAELREEASPHSDIHLLFQHYNSVYFDNALGATRVEWSSARMTRRDPGESTSDAIVFCDLLQLGTWIGPSVPCRLEDQAMAPGGLPTVCPGTFALYSMPDGARGLHWCTCRPANLASMLTRSDVYSNCSCAGTCARTEWGDCVIRLSKPILVLRPEEDLKNTLLHEMIHAYIMLHRVPGAGKDGHGPPFKDKMALINTAQVPDIHRPSEGYNVTVYHTMIDEVRHYQQHWWQCQRSALHLKLELWIHITFLTHSPACLSTRTSLKDEGPQNVADKSFSAVCCLVLPPPDRTDRNKQSAHTCADII